jgi:hypothetical protein
MTGRSTRYTGLFRLAAVLQQIYYRHGDTHNPAFKDFCISSVHLHWRWREIIKNGRV